ncbi:MAG: hypothetical protein WBV82_30090 [Myxococcaceae bacterium]
MKLGGLLNYQDLDVSGEVFAAAERMEARSFVHSSPRGQAPGCSR